MTVDEMAEKIGVSPATLHNKAKVIRDSLDIRRMDPRFSTKGMTDQNPLARLVGDDSVVLQCYFSKQNREAKLL